ncbi:MAG: SRPBCC family protein [Solirubrobacterales bacterium]
MPRIHISGCVTGWDRATALRRVVDYERWMDASEAIRSVRVEKQDDGSSISYWEVTFRKGLMRWSERDSVDPAAGVATFNLIEGDPQVFSGDWTVAAKGDDCVLTMEAEFDLGMPSLSHILDPIAIEAVEDSVASVLRGLFGEDTRIEYGEVASVAPRAPEGGTG